MSSNEVGYRGNETVEQAAVKVAKDKVFLIFLAMYKSSITEARSSYSKDNKTFHDYNFAFNENSSILHKAITLLFK